MPVNRVLAGLVVDGSVCDWGRVVAYEPPQRVVLSWQISADWRYDPSIGSEVEVRFVEEREGWGDILDRYSSAAGS